MAIESYIMAWAAYIVSAICAYFIFWRMTASWSKGDGGVKGSVGDAVTLVRFFALVLVFLPWFAWDDQIYMAPAALVFLFDLFINKGESGIRAALPLSIVCFTGVLLLLAEKMYLGRKQDVVKSESVRTGDS